MEVRVGGGQVVVRPVAGAAYPELEPGQSRGQPIRYPFQFKTASPRTASRSELEHVLPPPTRCRLVVHHSGEILSTTHLTHMFIIIIIIIRDGW